MSYIPYLGLFSGGGHCREACIKPFVKQIDRRNQRSITFTKWEVFVLLHGLSVPSIFIRNYL